MKQKIIPVVSVAIGIVAFILTYQYLVGKHRELARKEAEIYAGASRITVVAASHDIPAGTVVKKTDLGKISVFESAVRGHAVLPEDAGMLLGKKALFTLKVDEPIFWSDIEGGGLAGLGLAPVIKHGLRAISLSVSGAAAVSGMVQPNDRVDVLGTFSFPSETVPGEMEIVTLTVLQDVTVLATGQQLAKQRPSRRRGSSTAGYSTVTVEVTPREAELLVFAQQMKGRLTLSLRNPSDASFEAELPSINFDHLQGRLPELNLYRQREIRHKTDRDLYPSARSNSTP